jgi:chemotaxis protein MotB
MKKKNKLPPIHIFEGSPEWMTSYGDMMTLLLTFFILLYSVSQIESKKVFEMSKSFQKYFNLNIDAYGYSAQRVRLEKLPQAIADLGTPERNKTADEGRSLERQEAEIIDRYASLSHEESHDLIIIQGSVLFSPGTAAISEEVKPSLLRIAARLQRYRNRIKVLGHTSALPLDPSRGIADHEDLAYRRAKAVGRFLSGTDGDLGELARRLLPHRGDRITSDILAVDPDRFIYASRGFHSPLSRGRLWEDLEKNDRVELVFLSEFSDSAPEGGGR